MDAHISHICRTTHFHLRNIGAIRNLTDSAVEQTTNSFSCDVLATLLQLITKWGSWLQVGASSENAKYCSENCLDNLWHKLHYKKNIPYTQLITSARYYRYYLIEMHMQMHILTNLCRPWLLTMILWPLYIRGHTH